MGPPFAYRMCLALKTARTRAIYIQPLPYTASKQVGFLNLNVFMLSLLPPSAAVALHSAATLPPQQLLCSNLPVC